MKGLGRFDCLFVALGVKQSTIAHGTRWVGLVNGHLVSRGGASSPRRSRAGAAVLRRGSRGRFDGLFVAFGTKQCTIAVENHWAGFVKAHLVSCGGAPLRRRSRVRAAVLRRGLCGRGVFTVGAL